MDGQRLSPPPPQSLQGFSWAILELMYSLQQVSAVLRSKLGSSARVQITV